MSFLDELKRRNVVRTAIAYLAAAWLVLQVGDLVLEPLNAPAWIMTALIYAVAIVFPFVLIISWKYELTAEGLRPTEDVDDLPARSSRRFDLIVYSMMTLAIVVLVLDNYVLDEDPVAREASIAVLPLVSLSPDPSDVSFTGGMHDEILSALAGVGALKVISRTSVLPYADSPKNIRDIADELDVAHILEGSVRRAADTLRIDVKLIDARSDEQLWAETFDRTISTDTIFAIQSEIAKSVVRVLEAELTVSETARLAYSATESLEAYEFYLSGMDKFSGLHNRQTVTEALSQFQFAVDADPSFALAWVGLANAQLWIQQLMPSEEARARVMEALERAENLQPGLPEAELVRAQIATTSLDRDAAERHFAAAGRSLSGTALYHGYKGWWHQVYMELDAAVASYDRALELSPRDPLLHMRQARTLAKQRNYTRAEAVAARGLAFNPDCRNCAWTLGRMRLFGGADASAVLDAVRERDTFTEVTGFDVRRSSQLKFDLAWRYGDYALARAVIDEWASQPQGAPDPLVVRFERARLDALAPDTEVPEEEFRSLLSVLEPILEANPGNSGLLSAVGQIHAWLGESGPAADAARELIKKDIGLFAFDEQVWVPAMFEILLVARETDYFLEELDRYLIGPGSWSVESLSKDPRLDYLREDARFVAIVEKHQRP